MKIYITTHGEYNDNHVSLCTIDFELAIKHFINYSKTSIYNVMSSIEVWEDSKRLLDYGQMRYDVVNLKENATFNEIKDDILKQLGISN